MSYPPPSLCCESWLQGGDPWGDPADWEAFLSYDTDGGVFGGQFASLEAACAGLVNASECVLVGVTINVNQSGGVREALSQSLVLVNVTVNGPVCENTTAYCNNGQWGLTVQGNLTLANGTTLFLASAEITVSGSVYVDASSAVVLDGAAPFLYTQFNAQVRPGATVSGRLRLNRTPLPPTPRHFSARACVHTCSCQVEIACGRLMPPFGEPAGAAAPPTAVSQSHTPYPPPCLWRFITQGPHPTPAHAYPLPRAVCCCPRSRPDRRLQRRQRVHVQPAAGPAGQPAQVHRVLLWRVVVRVPHRCCSRWGPPSAGGSVWQRGAAGAAVRQGRLCPRRRAVLGGRGRHHFRDHRKPFHAAVGRH